jgi:transposase
VPRQVEREFWRKVALGLTTDDAAVAVGVSRATGEKWFRDGGGMPTLELSEPTGRYLSMAEREEIAVLRGHVGVREIARQLGRSSATISRELRRNATGGLPSRYRATVAQAEADRRARRPKSSKLIEHPPLRDYVQDKLSCDEHWTGAPSRSPGASCSSSPTMSGCGSVTRRSTRRSTCRAAVRCAAN